METLTTIVIAGLVLSLYGWRIMTPYFLYRDIASGASDSGPVFFIFNQGAVASLACFIIFPKAGPINITNLLIFIGFLSVAIVSFYFGTKAWLLTKQK
jgi:hypothetical protein